MARNILVQYFEWHFFDVPKEILRGWKNYLRFYSYFFSVSLLLKTLFSPWKRAAWSYGRGFSFKRYIETFISNIFSRFIGMFLRLILIIFALIVETLIILLGFLFYISWLCLPAVFILSLFFGIKFLF